MECNNKAPLLRLSGVISESIVDGPGFRYVVFTQGCPHGCPGCHNPQTHDFNGGTLIDPLTLLPEIDENPLLAGVTFSGGEPFCQPEALLPLAREIKARGLHLLIFSGYTYEQLQAMAASSEATAQLLRLCDTLIDGPYIEEQRDLTLQFRGSANQRVLQLADGQII
ncbi:MAG: anaerobic ribonucleoside-triphosphate reductase activating protein [Firmicutes bacterium]|nr:anaerobic ribonucleoside-triphosphate reductase activating protein [Bacillota bacterium]MBQ2270589.1 anaerobic ribonucleoside-triphosphate reductase activating protein [Bacillota bacterium]MBR6500530.1 anaerobic ribonucleoside-triphosphate reductase activating protein [Bacillota bacterium]